MRDIPFARFAVAADDELPRALAGAGLDAARHRHAPCSPTCTATTWTARSTSRGPVLVHDAEWAYAHTAFSRLFQRVLRQPIPDGRRLPAGRARRRAVRRLRGEPAADRGRPRRRRRDARPHARALSSVVCVDDEGRHVLLAGDATDTLEQLRARRADAVAPEAEGPRSRRSTASSPTAASTRPSTCPRTTPSPPTGWRRAPCCEGARRDIRHRVPTRPRAAGLRRGRRGARRGTPLGGGPRTPHSGPRTSEYSKPSP